MYNYKKTIALLEERKWYYKIQIAVEKEVRQKQ